MSGLSTWFRRAAVQDALDAAAVPSSSSPVSPERFAGAQATALPEVATFEVPLLWSAPTAEPWGELAPVGESAAFLLRGRDVFLLGPRERSVAVGRNVSPRSLKLDVPSVSCTHFTISCAGTDAYFLIDDSTNGTWVNGTRCARGAPVGLSDGAVISLCGQTPTSAKSISFRFAARGVAPRTRPPEAAAVPAKAVQASPDDSEPPPTACCVCLVQHVRAVSLPCAHIATCASCDARLSRAAAAAGTSRTCPLCREPCVATVMVRWP